MTSCLLLGGRLDLDGPRERGGSEDFLQVRPLLQPSALAASKLGVDQYELWADGLRQHDRARRYQLLLMV